MAKRIKLAKQWLKDKSSEMWVWLWSNNNNTRLSIIIGFIVSVYIIVFLFLRFFLCAEVFFKDDKGYTIINKLYEQLTLVTAALIALAFQYFRVKIRDQQVNEQAKQVNEQAKQTENLRKDISLKTKTQQDDQFKKAIELLSNSDSTFAARAGAVYLLGSLGCESQTHAQSCLDMLAELNRWMGQRLASHPDYFHRRTAWHSQVVTYDSQSLINHYTLIEPKKDGEPDIKDLSKEQQQLAKQSLEAEDLSRLALIKITDIIKTHAHDDGTSNKNLSGFNLKGKFLCQLNLSILHLDDRVDFSNTRLQGADLYKAHLQRADLRHAQMQGAKLSHAQMQGAKLSHAQMQGAKLYKAHLQRANLPFAQMQGADLLRTQIQGAILYKAQMQGADLRDVQMQGAELALTQIQGADLYNAQMQGTDLASAKMQGIDLAFTQMQGADLWRTQMQGANFNDTNMQGVSITRGFLDFEKRISPRLHIDKLERNQTGKLTDEDIKTIIKNLEDNENVSPTIIDDIKERLQSRANTAPNLDGIIYGQLTQEECDTIINDYKKAMKGVPKR